MKNRSVILKRFLLVCIFAMMLLPFVQNRFNLFDISPLRGAVSETAGPELSFDGWFSGEYQKQKETYLNEEFGFRNLFVRMNNQIAFSFFNKAKANGVVIGKENYLFEENYIKAYYGTDFIGVDSVVHRMQRVKFVQEKLAAMNKTLVLVFAAGKGSFYPEYIPDCYKTSRRITNFELHTHLAALLGINHIDFNSYFVANKNISKYPLYPQYGIHWSYYGSCLAADSMIKYIEQKRQIDLPDIYWESLEVCQPKFEDYDIGDGMNIWFRMKSFDMAYPKICTEQVGCVVPPSLLVVADSYYWEMYNYGFPRSFSNNHFWYYNKQVYPESFNTAVEASQLNFAEAIASHDVIIVMATEATLPEFGWGFFERAYDYFTGKPDIVALKAAYDKKVADLKNYIRTDEKWMADIERKASENNISVDSMITLDAVWQIENENKK